MVSWLALDQDKHLEHTRLSEDIVHAIDESLHKLEADPLNPREKSLLAAVAQSVALVMARNGMRAQ